ncbi:hypothetical protein RHGRI_007783 [Rhododendron griersonianum]|uniref:K Homology domain-containing protein n=1 Tax=Rhododendron griersonianum TaxID=479676 RepID=A0AAV6KXZ2_9ERIC|nr:hypothetical protein RHGRI_007783 [Rhododendron griersonianum]
MHSPSLSAGAVIGKKGKVVEKIRKETGCRISVLSSVKSPHSEEIIEVLDGLSGETAGICIHVILPLSFWWLGVNVLENHPDMLENVLPMLLPCMMCVWMKTLGQLKRRAYERLIFDNVYRS